jgi:molecular chaperone DnaK
MNRTTIDFGIDLGTTNSAIAVLKGVSTEIIKSNSEADITPSAVSIDKKGVVQVGQRARNRAYDTHHSKDTHQEFKRQMGTKHVYRFPSSGEQRLPEELSAAVLGSLRADVQQRTGELVESAVITVPAAFELHQCDATRKAGQLAGLRECPLLQEPVAAALAHGFQADRQKAFWLVYDFGGGTFDAAIIKAEEGAIHVVNHGGDNFLGGSDIDWAIVEHLLVPRLTGQYDLKDFSRNNPKWHQTFALLKYHAEIAKIDLSRNERSTIELRGLVDSDGQAIELECDLTRKEIAGVAEPFVRSSVEICQRVLKEKKLGKDAVEKIVLVGGPTLAPYFRDLLSSCLGLRLDFTVDPLTVVARGAAVFAGSQKTKSTNAKPIAAGEFRVELANAFKPVGAESAPPIGGKFVGPQPDAFEGFAMELVNVKTQWRSGKIKLRADGVFFTTLHAEFGERNTFSVELYDPAGRKQIVIPSTVSYTIGAVVEEQPLINSMGAALANNECAIFFEKGRGLPLKGRIDFKTVVALRQGETGSVLRVPIFEGENEKADRNRKVGELTIEGAKIRRDLPAGSEVEVTLRIDEARLLSVTGYVPLLDEEFIGKFDMSRTAADPAFLRRDFEGEMKRFKEVQAKAQAANGATAAELIQAVESSQLMADVKAALGAAGGDPDAAAKCEKRLLELKVKLDEATDALEWPLLVEDAKEWMESLNKAVTQHVTAEQKVRAEVLIGDTEEAIRVGRAGGLRKKTEQLTRIYWEIITAQPGWWVLQLQGLERTQTKATDQDRAKRLLNQGRECIDKNNVPGLQSVVRQLWELFPSEEATEARRGYESGVVR